MPPAREPAVWATVATESGAEATSEDRSDSGSDGFDGAASQRREKGLIPQMCASLVVVLGVIAVAFAVVGSVGGRDSRGNAASGASEDMRTAEHDASSCDTSPPPPLWAPAADDVPLRVKVLSYNLFWWNLFGINHGNNGSAGKLIQEHSKPELFDFMGFQECEDPEIVLEGKAPPPKHKRGSYGSCAQYGCGSAFTRAHGCQCNAECTRFNSCCSDYAEKCVANTTKRGLGLLKDYAVFLGSHAICMGYAKSRWTLIDRGEADVSEDMPTQTYGTRGAQWMRLKSKKSNQYAFFVNHHGPLSVNSGGICGGHVTANNLVKLMTKNAKPGDLIILVGDFNANAASLTIQGLWSHLTHVFAGNSWGGVDNVFSNCDPRNIVQTSVLGSGGSDHNAISAVIDVGVKEVSAAGVTDSMTKGRKRAVQELRDSPSDYDWQKFWCGRYEQDIEYQYPENTWSDVAGHRAGISPQWCCRECQELERCKSWTWYKHHSDHPASVCIVKGALPTSSIKKPSNSKIVSGLPVPSAITAAASAAEVTDDVESYVLKA
eukprot:TRINITY_DN15804_c0_g2_i1.p1 TRINITY_DN15804_c0_g2~~TRINITY_DN15804_c0_g2_i1.p1  ORF type:complete len:547 (+),score=71.76 TRINITY_DN15804_c0_g2_i1:78-1718(+)